MSLRLRLVISIGLALLASLALGGTLAFWAAAHQVQTEMRAAIALGQHVAQTLLDDANPASDRRLRLKRLITQFDGNRHLQAFLVNRNNQVSLASKLEPPENPAPPWFRRLVDRGSQVVKIALPAEFDDYEAVVFTTDAGNEAAEKWGDIGWAVAALIAFCGFVLGLVYCTLAIGLRPLQDLNFAFVRVGKGDYSIRVVERGATELIHLARQFNEMVTRLSTMKHQNDRLNDQLTNVQEEERADLARELHDEIGPFLFAAGLDVSAMYQITRTDGDVSARLISRLETLREAILHMQKHIKIILGRLRPAVLLDLGLAPALENLIEFWKGRHPDVVFRLTVCQVSLDDDLDEAIYRIVREALNNALRHGRPTEIDVRICLEDDTLAVDILDDGGGIELAANASVGFGIVGMKERAALLGGRLFVENRSDRKGVVVSARLPFTRTPSNLGREVEEAVSE